MGRGERWLLTGATGLVGSILSESAARVGVEVLGTSLSGRSATLPCDLRDARATRRLLDETAPDRVIHLAAVSKPAAAHERPDLARELNVEATGVIAEWCHGRRGLIFSSTDQVFSGGDGPHRETDHPAPATVYGETKLAAERLVAAAGGTVVRLGWVLNDRPSVRADFIEYGLARLRRGETVTAADDEHRTPVYGADLAHAIGRLAELDHRGVVHVAGPVHATPFQLLRARAGAAGLDPSGVRAISRRHLAPAGRPRDVRLDTSLLQRLLPHPSEALHA